MPRIKSVLFVCWGNVCRSPAAELMLKRSLECTGTGYVRIESAGVGADADWFRPSFSMWWASLLRGLWLKSTPRLFRKQDCSKFDLIIAMDRDVQFSISNIAQQLPDNVKLMSDFLPDGSPIDVPDPMDRPLAVCNRVLDMLDRACQEIGTLMEPDWNQTVSGNLPGVHAKRKFQLKLNWFEHLSMRFKAGDLS